MTVLSKEVQSVKGRPRRTLVDEIKVKSYMWLAAWIAGIEPRGKFFRQKLWRRAPYNREPHKLSNINKWLRGYSTPSEEERMLLASTLKDEGGQLERLFHLPLWSALKPDNLTDQELVKIYSGLYFDIQKILFIDCFNHGSLRHRKKVTKHTIDELRKVGDLMALSCLIALIRDRYISLEEDIKEKIILTIYELTAINILMGPLSTIDNEMVTILDDVMSDAYSDIHSIHPGIKRSALIKVNEYISIHLRQLYIANEIGLGYSIDAYSKASFWATRTRFGNVWDLLGTYIYEKYSHHDRAYLKTVVENLRHLSKRRYRYNIY